MTPFNWTQKKNQNKKIVMITAYDFPTAKIIEKSGQIDVVLVGDSLGNVVMGLEDTSSVTMDHMIYHCQAVKRGAPSLPVVGDMPYMSHDTKEKAIKNAALLIEKGHADLVKIECNSMDDVAVVRAVVESGVQVMAHIGFTPQFLKELGGYKIQGKDEDSAKKLLELGKSLEQAGACSTVIEMVPIEVGRSISKALTMPTIGIGAGPHCDGQVLVLHDVIGLTQGRKPSFIKQYTNTEAHIVDALTQFNQEIQTLIFPSEKESFKV